MRLDDVNKGVTKYRRRSRVGRGPGSGHGKTSGRGHKGARSRAGWSRLSIFQGGMMPLVRMVPKRGFNNPFGPLVFAVNVADLERTFEPGTEITPDLLRSKKLARGRFDQLKVLGDGDLHKKFTVSAHRFSKSAVEKIEAAGGKVVRIPDVTPVEEKKQAARMAATPTKKKK